MIDGRKKILSHVLVGLLSLPFPLAAVPPPPPPPPSLTHTPESEPLKAPTDPEVRETPVEAANLAIPAEGAPIEYEAQNRVLTVVAQILVGGFIGVGAAFIAGSAGAITCLNNTSECETRIDLGLRIGWVVGTAPVVWSLGEVMGWDGSFLATLLGCFVGASLPPYGEFENLPLLMLVSMGGSVVGYHLTASPRPVTHPESGMNPRLNDSPHVGTAKATFFPVLTLDF